MYRLALKPPILQGFMRYMKHDFSCTFHVLMYLPDKQQALIEYLNAFDIHYLARVVARVLSGGGTAPCECRTV